MEEMINSILGIYVPESDLPITYPDEEKAYIEDRLLKDWNIFSGTLVEVKQLVAQIVNESIDLDARIDKERVGIPQLFEEAYLRDHSIMGKYSWSVFKKYLRNENRFHSKYINLEMLESVLKRTEIIIPVGTNLYRARVSNKKGYTRKEMWAPPDDMASPGRANSKGQSCLYLCSNRKTTVKEIRAHAFDYVTIATFKFKRDVRVLDLSSIVHSSPFYSGEDKVAYLVNESNLRQIQDDLAKPMSRLDSELDYLPTQYISDFAKFLGYDGVKYFSTFDKTSYNVALFDSSACNCTYHRNFLIGDLDYRLTAV
ncbi:MAG: RES family NAD+ phosphorylase [Lachnospiraceae bacterium]|nr:RES family NAD+ phosphorylase [Lachnospiraceae bacterium]